MRIKLLWTVKLENITIIYNFNDFKNSISNSNKKIVDTYILCLNLYLIIL